MSWVVARIRWVMLVSGLLTLTMVQAVVAPGATLRTMFGAEIEGPVAEIVVRNWGALIALVGAMLVYGAFRPQVRTLVLLVAALGKVIFIALIFTFGRQFLGHAGIAVAVDSIMVLLFLAYLVTPDRARTAA